MHGSFDRPAWSGPDQPSEAAYVRTQQRLGAIGTRPAFPREKKGDIGEGLRYLIQKIRS